MQANSATVFSNQTGIHDRLEEIVGKHLRQPSNRPIAERSGPAIRILSDRLAQTDKPIILDSFCGTGHSSYHLAAQHPEHLVIAVDQSAQRLSKHPFQQNEHLLQPGKVLQQQDEQTPTSECPNYFLLQADCEDIWHWLFNQNISISKHYLLYPNPWPKAKHFKRRVHGNDALFWLLRLGGDIELRSNWDIYVKEFAAALQLASRQGSVEPLQPGTALTLFEKKYRESHQPLWQYRSPKP